MVLPFKTRLQTVLREAPARLEALRAWAYQSRLPAIHYCTAAHPMPEDADRLAWHHADYAPDGFDIDWLHPDHHGSCHLVPVVKCLHCGAVFPSPRAVWP